MEKIEKGKHLVMEADRLVGFGHTTKTMDGEVTITTYFDFKNVSLARLLYFAASACLIKWRASSGIKNLATVEAQKLDMTVVDCSKSAERVKHVETPEEKELKALIAAKVKAGGSIKDILASLKATLSEGDAQKDMDEGETTE